MPTAATPTPADQGRASDDAPPAALAFPYARDALSMLVMWRRADRGIRGAPLLGPIARLTWSVRRLERDARADDAYWCIASLGALQAGDRDAAVALARGPLRAAGWRVLTRAETEPLTLSSRAAPLDRVLLTLPGGSTGAARAADSVTAGGARPRPTLLLAFDSHPALAEAIDALSALADTDVIEGTRITTGPTAAAAIGSATSRMNTTSIVGGWWLLVPAPPTFLSGGWLEGARSRNGLRSIGPVRAYREWSMPRTAASGHHDAADGATDGATDGADDRGPARVFIGADEEPALLVDLVSDIAHDRDNELLLVSRAHSIAKLQTAALVPLADRMVASADRLEAGRSSSQAALEFAPTVGHAIDVAITITPPTADLRSTPALTALDNLHVADCLWCCPESGLRHRPWWLDDLRPGARGNIVMLATQHALVSGEVEVVYWLREVFPGHAVAELSEIALPFTRYRPGRRDAVGRRIDSADRRDAGDDVPVYLPAGTRVEPEVAIQTLALALRGVSTSRFAVSHADRNDDDSADRTATQRGNVSKAAAPELVVLVPIDATGRSMTAVPRAIRGVAPTWTWRRVDLTSVPSRPLSELGATMWRAAAPRLHALVDAARLAAPATTGELAQPRGAATAEAEPDRDDRPSEQEWW